MVEVHKKRYISKLITNKGHLHMEKIDLRIPGNKYTRTFGVNVFIDDLANLKLDNITKTMCCINPNN